MAPATYVYDMANHQIPSFHATGIWRCDSCSAMRVCFLGYSGLACNEVVGSLIEPIAVISDRQLGHRQSHLLASMSYELTSRLEGFTAVVARFFMRDITRSK
jgi:hypothetical protein